MTRDDWLTSTDPAAMLHWLTSDATRKPSDRKLRLFACACCYAVWDRLTDPRSRRAVEVAERFADGLATKEELRAAQLSAVAVPHSDLAYEYQVPILLPAWCCVASELHGANLLTAGQFWQTRYLRQLPQCAILRAIIGDPFRPVTLDPHCRTPDVLAIAQRIYDDRDWDAMPMLADALETAGCEDVRVLEWLRGPACEYCNGEGMLCGVYSAKLYTTVPLSQARTGCRLTGDPETCKVCSGTGRIQPARCRGDWCLDLVLGRE